MKILLSFKKKKKLTQLNPHSCVFLTFRLRLLIGKVVSEAPTTFVKDRQILDGLLIVNEAVDDARKLNKELLLFKVDFEKAYDSVD